MQQSHAETELQQTYRAQYTQFPQELRKACDLGAEIIGIGYRGHKEGVPLERLKKAFFSPEANITDPDSIEVYSGLFDKGYNFNPTKNRKIIDSIEVFYTECMSYTESTVKKVEDVDGKSEVCKNAEALANLSYPNGIKTATLTIEQVRRMPGYEFLSSKDIYDHAKKIGVRIIGDDIGKLYSECLKTL